MYTHTNHSEDKSQAFKELMEFNGEIIPTIREQIFASDNSQEKKELTNILDLIGGKKNKFTKSTSADMNLAGHNIIYGDENRHERFDKNPYLNNKEQDREKILDLKKNLDIIKETANPETSNFIKKLFEIVKKIGAFIAQIFAKVEKNNMFIAAAVIEITKENPTQLKEIQKSIDNFIGSTKNKSQLR